MTKDSMATKTAPKISALAPWFGSNRMLASAVGEELAGCSWVGVPFAGGMAELPYITASTIVVSDRHAQVMNLANVVRHPALGPMLYRDLNRLPFHPYELRHAQEHCLRVETRGFAGDVELEGMETAYVDALNYFVACWMGRSAKAGTDDEFSGGLPVRWSASGGDSNTRYRSAARSLVAWRKIMQRCNFVVLDVFDFLDRVKDEPGIGLYLDPPFPGPGDAYKHKFSEAQHVQLSARLAAFAKARIVCRFYAVPLIRELYPEELGGWQWRHLKGRKQSNDEAPEVLIVNGPIYGEARP